ncbi:MAG: hypothetical protein ACRDD2_07520 [Sarcina sp.]
MEIYYLTETKGTKRDAGSKARNDVDDILKSEKYQAIIMLNKDENGKVGFLPLVKSFFKQKRTIAENSIIISQYPIYDQSVFMRFYLRWMKKYKNIKHIALIHDLNSLRAQNKEKMIEEIKRLEVFDLCISHNEKMSKWLKENGLKSKLVNLEIFDYLIDEEIKKEYKKEENYTVCFAGNLSADKSGFIYKLDERVNLNLYGPYYSGNNEKRYKGCLKPEELPKVLNEDFGLVWDGESLEGCVGEMGEYLKFNNPHKTSLYIASDLPIIIWKEAALADFILKNNIGIVIGSLNELYNKLNDISEDEYKEMKNNLTIIRNKVINGEFTKKAIKEAIGIIKNS